MLIRVSSCLYTQLAACRIGDLQTQQTATVLLKLLCKAVGKRKTREAVAKLLPLGHHVYLDGRHAHKKKAAACWKNCCQESVDAGLQNDTSHAIAAKLRAHSLHVQRFLQEAQKRLNPSQESKPTPDSQCGSCSTLSWPVGNHIHGYQQQGQQLLIACIKQHSISVSSTKQKRTAAKARQVPHVAGPDNRIPDGLNDSRAACSCNM